MKSVKKYSIEKIKTVRVRESLQGYNSQKDFTTLDAWKKCRDVKLFFYKNVLPLLPSEEKFNLGNQIRRASISVTANIAEGYGRYHYQEGVQFYRISRASLYELKDHLISSLDLEFISDNMLMKGTSLIEDAKATLNGYIRYAKKQKDKIDEKN